MIESYHFRCPKCNRTLGIHCGLEEAPKTFCTDCGTLMINTDKRVEPETQEPAKIVEPTSVKNFSSDFEFISPVAVTETKAKKTIISGTLLSEGISKNGNFYSIQSLEQLDNLSDIPIYVGTDSENRHTKTSGVIGKIVKTTFDKVNKKVKFVAEIFNESVAKKIKSGWGISIGGKGSGELILDSLGKIVTAVRTLVLNHVQLLMPSTIRGMDDAKVESVEFTETMIFKNIPYLTKNQILQLIATLAAKGEL